MFRFFFCAFVFSTSCMRSSYPGDESQALFTSQPCSPSSISSTQPPSPIMSQRTRLLAGLDDSRAVGFTGFENGVIEHNRSGDSVTIRNVQPAAVVVPVPYDDRCHCVVNTNNPYCRSTLFFLGYFTVVAGVGGIITAIVHYV